MMMNSWCNCTWNFVLCVSGFFLLSIRYDAMLKYCFKYILIFYYLYRCKVKCINGRNINEQYVCNFIKFISRLYFFYESFFANVMLFIWIIKGFQILWTLKSSKNFNFNLFIKRDAMLPDIRFLQQFFWL